MTGPEQHAAALRVTIERAYKRGKALYPIPADAYDAERAAALAELDELVALAGRAQEDADGSRFLRGLADASSDNWRARAEAAEARADELQRELDEIADLTTQKGRQEQNIRSLYKGRAQARREAVQLRAALVEHHAAGAMDGVLPGDPCPVCAALAGVQAEEQT